MITGSLNKRFTAKGLISHLYTNIIRESIRGLCKAFEKANRDILLYMLDHYGSRSSGIQYIKSCFTDNAMK